MRRRALCSLGAGLFFELACGPASEAPRTARAPLQKPPLEPPAAPTSAPSATPPAAPVNGDVVALLDSDAVHHTSFARRELYTWTTAEQIVELRRDGWLLRRTQARDGRRSLFDMRVGARTGEIEKLLAVGPLRFRRFAWPSPWATAAGMGEPYGDRLVKMVLRADALYGRFDARLPGGWAFQDADGESVHLGDVLRAPQRLGAVLHVWHGDEEQDSSLGPETAFREYVVCNESMVERYEVGTPAVGARLRRDVAMLRALRDDLGARGGRAPASLDAWSHFVDNRVWPSPPADGGDVVVRWEAGLAFPLEPYVLMAEKLEALAKALETTAPEAPFVGQPHRAYGAKPPDPDPPDHALPCGEMSLGRCAPG